MNGFLSLMENQTLPYIVYCLFLNKIVSYKISIFSNVAKINFHFNLFQRIKLAVTLFAILLFSVRQLVSTSKKLN